MRHDDPARTALPHTVQIAESLRETDPVSAFYVGVQAGRVESIRRPDALVLVFEPGLSAGERERLRLLVGSLRGVAAVVPSGRPPDAA